MNGERRLRAACDRCHELKNRCTRTSGAESRCDRCERLDIDCVYNTSARIGRPRTSQKGASDSHARHSKRRVVQTENRRGTAVPHPVDHVETVSAVPAPTFGHDGPGPGSPGDLEPVLGLLDPVLLSEGDNLNWDLGFYSRQLTHLAHDDPAGGHGHDHYVCHPIENRWVSDLSDSDPGASEKESGPVVMSIGADELLRLQSHLSNMLKSASEPSTGPQPALDEVMMACKDLLELLPMPVHRPSSDHNRNTANKTATTGPPLTPNSISAGPRQPGYDEPRQRQGGPFDPLRINYITVLQVATSYAYALQLLDLAVDHLKTHAGSLALVSMGIFNLASQPAMSISVGAYMISSMVHQLRDAISLLMPGQLQQEVPPLPHGLSPPPPATAANRSIQAAVNMISENEASLLEKLAQVMVNP
ncbi:hypothetical protein BDW74DRAFT_180479 [Aspergillus multicolor]|uniref:Zn(II)2Cys6 transcription factor domain-containing protein n=1 Tax=Aspergillus multicolor TaxID=41759 RepID=UPI003CCDB1F2